jgi:hypothetical protein
MWLMWVVGGLVIGLLVFLMLRRRVKRDEIAAKFKGQILYCSKGHDSDAGEAWRRSGLRGELFVCPRCGERIWA